MASNISVFLRFSDGTFGSLRSTVTSSSTAFGQYTEITTEGGDLNQTEGVSAGQAFNGLTCTHAFAKASKDDGLDASFVAAYFENTDGSIAVPIQGGGQIATGLPALKKPMRMATGVVVKAAYQDVADGATELGTLAVYCASGKSDVFAALGVDSTPTAMVNPQGKTIGQALDGQTISCAYATYGATNGLDDNDDGVNAFYIENAQGTLKAMYPISKGTGQLPVPYISYPVKISQNDTLTITSSVA